MYRNHEIGVVVPAYNEEGFVGDVVREMPEYVDRIYAVDDRSTDDTWAEIWNAAEADARERSVSDEATALVDGGVIRERSSVRDRIGRVVPIRHRENRGAGGAIKTGYLLAFEDGVDITVTVDGDGQMDLDQMTRLLDPIVEGRVGYAKGNRLRRADTGGRMPTWRLFGNSILTYLTRIASGYWKMMDPQNGYTAISREALDAVEIEELYEYYGYCNDLLVKLNAGDVRIGDVTMEPIYGDEESDIAYAEYIPRVSGMLLRNFLWRLRTKYLTDRSHSLAPAYVAGGIVSLIGTVSGLRSMFVRVARNERAASRGTSSIPVFAIGWSLVLLGIALDMKRNEEMVARIDD